MSTKPNIPGRGGNTHVHIAAAPQIGPFLHVLCVLGALQRTQNTQNVYYNFRSPKATRLYKDIAPRFQESTRQVLYPMSKNRDNLSNNRRDELLTTQVMKALDVKYRLAEKMAKEPGLKDIIQQFIGRIEHAFGSLAHVKGRRILDIACGSNTSKAPESFFVNTPFGERTIRIADTSVYTAQFEPWFCRILLELGADAVGVDIGDLEGEAFEHYYVDLGTPGALDFLPGHSFDALQDSRLFGSPEFTAIFPERSQRLRVAEEMKKQEQRLLKKKGIIIHSDIPQPLDPKAGGH